MQCKGETTHQRRPITFNLVVTPPYIDKELSTCSLLFDSNLHVERMKTKVKV